jgi:predicted nucleotidyltransferase
MDRRSIIAALHAHREDLAKRFAAKDLALFGSAARDQLRPDSDIDILVDFEGPATFDGYFGLKDYLEQLLGRPVDLVTERGLKPRARQRVQREMIRVA